MRYAACLLSFFGVVTALAARQTPAPPTPIPARLNILWISNEDMSPHLGAYGDPVARTPMLDRLARESLRYTRAFTTAPVCAPSRAAIITGMYQNAIGAQHMRTTEDRVPELPGPYLAVPPFYVKAFPWSDHGDGVPRAKRSLYDSGLHVPLMIRWPQMSPAIAAKVNDQLVSFIDLAPTVLAIAGVEIPSHLQGRVLLGPKAAGPPPYVFAARDRMDTEYDMMRSARDQQFLYIRNFAPEQPYAGHITYRNQSDIMQEWFRLQAEGALSGPAALWMRTHRPAEELYDTQSDPHQIRDLSGETRHRETLERMRRAVTDWMTRINDQGLVNEPEMIQRMWPGGVQPETAQPYILLRQSTDVHSRQATMRVKGPTEAVIYVPTQGTSIGYTTEEGPSAKWRLYTGPIPVNAPMTLRAKAIRYGYKESEETRTVFTRD